MKCPFCGHQEHKVLDSRPAREGYSIRRRRECESCSRRFTTFEESERPRLFIIKRDGSRQEFNRDKVFESMRVACGKRPVKVETLRDAAERIEWSLCQEYDEEAPSTAIGEGVMNELHAIDTVAYIRFASVYREFETVSDFSEIVEAMKRHNRQVKASAQGA